VGRFLFRYKETLRHEKVMSWGFRELLPHITHTRYNYLDGGLQNAEVHIDSHRDWGVGDVHHQARREFHRGHHLELPRDHAAAGGIPHQPRQHARHLQIHALGVRAELDPVQRPYRSLANEPPVLLAGDGRHGFGPIDRTFIIKYVRQFDLLN
jgi:hypothetical protein